MTPLHPAPPADVHGASLLPIVLLAVVLAVLLLVGTYLTARR